MYYLQITSNNNRMTLLYYIDEIMFRDIVSEIKKKSYNSQR